MASGKRNSLEWYIVNVVLFTSEIVSARLYLTRG